MNLKKLKNIKINPIFAFIMGVLLTGGTVYAVATSFAQDVSFTSKKGLVSTNVQDAIDELYEKIGQGASSNKVYFFEKYYPSLADVMNDTNIYGYIQMNQQHDNEEFICVNLKNDQDVPTEVCGNLSSPHSASALQSLGFTCGGSSSGSVTGWGCGIVKNSKNYSVRATTESGSTTSLTVTESYEGTREEHESVCIADSTSTRCEKNDIQYGKCRRAKESELHSDGNGGYYGQVGTTGELNVGDAFVCDINNDGKFKASNEMFYYKSDYYDEETKSYDSNYAVLLYYKNLGTEIQFLSSVTSGESKTIEFYDRLPSTSDWSLFSLKKTNRLSQKSAADGNTSGYEGGIEQNNIDSSQYSNGYFKYGDRAARLLTHGELRNGCMINVNNYSSQCNFLFENSHNLGFWIETTSAGLNGLAFNQNDAHVELRQLNHNAGVRPAIDVKKTDISY